MHFTLTDGHRRTLARVDVPPGQDRFVVIKRADDPSLLFPSAILHADGTVQIGHWPDGDIWHDVLRTTGVPSPTACQRCGTSGFLARATEWADAPALCVDCHDVLGTQQAREGHQCLDGCQQTVSHHGLCHP
ncbi:hypothetical protein [Streptomyces sp. NBC_00470]|uniref:hypothetical protein n=1 Tax=Streptomyces sp. NBC_00470 TaxID=2975753 RepID=UPI002F90A0E8